MEHRLLYEADDGRREAARARRRGARLRRDDALPDLLLARVDGQYELSSYARPRPIRECSKYCSSRREKPSRSRSAVGEGSGGLRRSASEEVKAPTRARRFLGPLVHATESQCSSRHAGQQPCGPQAPQRRDDEQVAGSPGNVFFVASSARAGTGSSAALAEDEPAALSPGPRSSFRVVSSRSWLCKSRAARAKEAG